MTSKNVHADSVLQDGTQFPGKHIHVVIGQGNTGAEAKQVHVPALLHGYKHVAFIPDTCSWLLRKTVQLALRCLAKKGWSPFPGKGKNMKLLHLPVIVDCLPE